MTARSLARWVTNERDGKTAMVWRVSLAMYLLAVSLASAEEPRNVFVSYTVNMEGSVVRGAMMVARVVDGEEVPEGYSFQRVIEFITEDCASGKVTNVKLGKKRHFKKKGYIHQRFRTTCLGGPHPSIGAVRQADVVIERQEDGRDLAEYTYSIDGYVKTSERFR